MNTIQKITFGLVTITIYFGGITTGLLIRATQQQELSCAINIIEKASFPGLLALVCLAGSFGTWSKS